MSHNVLIAIAFICGMVFGAGICALAIANSRKIINCPDCKYYYAPVCTFYKNLPMVSRKGYCYHAVKGKYKGDTPTVTK